MKFYQVNNKWHAINNCHSKYWEINKGYGEFKCVELTAPHVVGFGWAKDEKSGECGKITLTRKQFLNYLGIVKKAHEIMLNRIKRIIKEVEQNA